VHVVIVGCGRVGSSLAAELDRAGHRVGIIDRYRRSFRRLPPDFTGTAVEGFGLDRGSLRRAGIEHAEGMVAVTSGDNTNIVAARIARETYAIDRVVARIYDPRRAEIYERLGIPTVATVAWTTSQVMRRLVPELRGAEVLDATGAVVVVERALPPAWVGRRLTEAEQPGKVRVVAVTRAGRAQLLQPDLVGQEGDAVLLAVPADALAGVKELLAEEAVAGTRH
jgi:trk/ktr system potassium uptake protein